MARVPRAARPPTRPMPSLGLARSMERLDGAKPAVQASAAASRRVTLGSSTMTAPLDAARLKAALTGTYAQVDVVGRTGSTNADLRAVGQAGGADRTVLFAEEQTAGQGRRARHWVSP